LYVAGYGELGFDTKFGRPSPDSVENTSYIGVLNPAGTNIPYLSANFYDDEEMAVVNFPLPIETGVLFADLSGYPDLYASYEVIALTSESSVIRGFLPIVPELYAGTYDYVFQNLNSAVRIGESLIDTTYFSVISGTDSSDNPGLLFGDTVYIYDQNNDTNMTLAFVSNDFSSVNVLGVSSDTGRLSYLSLSDSGLGSLGFDVLGDITASKSTTAGDGVTTAMSISAKPFLSACSVGDGVRMRFRSGREGGVFGTTVDTAYFESVMEDVGATTWESSFQGYVNNVSGSMQWLNVDADGTTIFPQVVRMVTGTNTNIETDELTIDLTGLIPDLYITTPILKPTAHSTLPETLPFPYALGTYDRFAVFAQGTFDQPEILFAYSDFSASASIGADLTNSYLWANWPFCPQEDDAYSLGISTLMWQGLWSSADVNIVSDTYGLKLGAEADMSVYYDGTTGQIKTNLIADSDLDVTCGTEKTVRLVNTVWDDIQFNIESGRVSVANFPDWDASFTTNTGCFKFDVDDYIDLGTNEMSHWWKEGTTIKPHVHVALDGANASGSSQYAKFTLYIAYADNGDVYTETSATGEIEIPTGSADMKKFFVSLEDVALTGKKIGTQINVRLKRIAATTGTEYPNHIFVTQVGIHAEVDTMGSRQVRTK